MAIQAFISGSDGSPKLNTVFIDTSLGTNLVTVVSSDETFSDLKKKLVHEHFLHYPHLGEIKIVRFEVEFRRKLYPVLESMLVKNAFVELTGGWFVFVVVVVEADADATDADKSRNPINPCYSNLLESSAPPKKKTKKKKKTKGKHTDVQRSTVVESKRTTFVESKQTGELQKHAEVSNAKSNKRSVDVICDQSLEDDLKSEPSAKRRREDLLKDREWVSKSNKLMFQNSTVSQKPPVGQHPTRNSTLDGSASETIHLQLVSNAKSNERSVDVIFDQSLENDLKSEPSAKRRRENLLKDRELVSKSNKLMLENSTISQKPPVGQHHTRNSTLDGSASETIHLLSVGPSNKKRKRKKKSAKPSNQEADVVHSRMKVSSSDLGDTPASALASGQHNEDLMSSELDAPGAICPKDKLGDPAQEIKLRPSSLENGTGNKEAANVGGGQNDAAEEHQNHVSGQNDGVHEGEFSPEIPPKTASLKKHGISAQDDLQSKAKEGIMASKLLEASETVNPPKLSKKKKKSKKTNDLASVTPPTPATEPVNGFIRSISPTKSQKINKGQLSDTCNKEETQRLPKVGKETDTVNTSFVATSEEINGVIQNIVESHLMGKYTTTENDQGIQSPEVAQKLESNSKNRCPEAVISGSPSRSGHANEVTYDVENSGINFNDYFTPKKQDLETVGSSEMLVDEATKIDGANGTPKAKKGKKKHATHSDGPSSNLKTPLILGGKPHAGNFTPAEVQVSFTKPNSEKTTLQPNKEPSEVSDRRAKPPVSNKSPKVNSVLEETPRSNDAKSSGTANGSNSKDAESNTESSKNTHLLRPRSNEHQSLEKHHHKAGRKASVLRNGEVVNSSNKERSLVRVLSSIFKVDGHDASSNVDDNSDASTRTPSDASLSSDYSDGESNADSDSSQNGSCNSKRDSASKKAKMRAIASGMTLDKILRSSSTFKKAKLTASQLHLEDPESLFIPAI